MQFGKINFYNSRWKIFFFLCSFKLKKSIHLLFALTILYLSCESTENRIEYFYPSVSKKTEAVQKICEDLSSLNINQPNLENYNAKFADIKISLQRVGLIY